MQEKTCSRCHQTYPATTEFFSVQRTTKSGLRSHCKRCIMAEYRVRGAEPLPDSFTCTTCQRHLPLSDFYVMKNGKMQKTCRACRSSSHSAWTKSNLAHLREYNKARRHRNIARAMCKQASARASAYGVPFDLRPEDVEIPEFCPIFGTRLEVAPKHKGADSPSLDRIVPELGYVRGNVAVISQRANRIKNNGTAEEHERIASWMRSHEKANRKAG